MINNVAWWITIIGVGMLTLVFWFVISRSSETAEYAPVQKAWYGVRKPWFYVLVLLGIVVTFSTLTPFPIAAQKGPTEASQIINVKGFQWYWTIDKTELKAGEPVEFRVTTEDVTHGFGIYNEDMRMVMQTQAIPGYTNRLQHTFDEPGKYQVLCLEYCGLAHHAMIVEFNVVAAAE